MTARAAPRRPAEAGFSLVEIAIVAVLVAFILLVTFSLVKVTGGVVTQTASTSELDQEVHRLVERLARELLPARTDTLAPSADRPLGTSVLTYERAEPAPGGGITWTAPRRIQLVQDPRDALDGRDNDGDGLVDEREIQLVVDVGLPTEQRVTLARNAARLALGETENAEDDDLDGLVDEPGLVFDRHDGVLRIQVTLQAVVPGRDLLMRSAETSIRLRN